MLAKLRQFVRLGGVLTGMSAGGILMNPTIASAGYPSFDKDANEENIKNLNALNLVKFEFYPHYRNSPRYDRHLSDRSKNISHPVYACPDEGGIAIEEDKMTFVGRCGIFFQGKKYSLF